jgi:hypothetical protein
MLNQKELEQLSAAHGGDHLDSIQNVYPQIREIVAKALASQEHDVNFGPDEVSIITEYVRTVVDPIDGAPPDGAMERHVQIIVVANRYDWRVPVKDLLAERIGEGIGKLLPPDVTYWVWLHLPEAGFYGGPIVVP